MPRHIVVEDINILFWIQFKLIYGNGYLYVVAKHEVITYQYAQILKRDNYF